MAGIIKVNQYQDFNGNTILTSDGSGNLTTQNILKPSFCAYRDYNNGGYQSIGNNSFTKAQYNAEYWDTNNDFDKDTNYRFTVSVAGRYHMGAYIIMDNTGDQSYLRVSIYKNGSEQGTNANGLNGITESSGSTPHQCNVTTNIDCVVGDYFEVYIKHNHGSSRDWRTEYGNVFYAYRIGN